MAWFRIDDTFAMHDKVMAAGNSAVGLWARAGAWSMQQLTDGFVPNHVVKVLGTTKERRQLVAVSLWDEVEGGVQFRNWDERQPTKNEVEERREYERERKKKYRRDKGGRYTGGSDEGAEQGDVSQDCPVGTPAGTPAGSPDGVPASVPPARPDPTLKKKTSSSSDRAKRGTRLDPEWMPDQQVREAMAAEFPHVDYRTEHAKFVDYWVSQPGQRGTKLDWNATWRNWIRNSADRGPARNLRPAAEPGLVVNEHIPGRTDVAPEDLPW